MTRATATLLVVLLASAPAAARGQDAKPVAVEPGELTKRPDLVGKEVVVDDRGGFQYHNETRSFDEIYLRRAPEVTCRLPQRLWTQTSPRASAVNVRGVLRREGNTWWIDVMSYDTLPTDLDRLNRALAQLAPGDVKSRTEWARWAVRRGREFGKLGRPRDPNRATGEEALLSRAREVLAEAIRAEADHPPAHDAAGYWLALSARAKAEEIPEPEPSALAHRGFRAALAGARTADQVRDLVARIEAAFPESPTPAAGAAVPAEIDRTYRSNPADAYRAAAEDVRAALDHRLWADATQTRLERRAAQDPKATIDLAEEAGRLLPDRPTLAAALLEKGVNTAAGDVGKLRQAEVEALARMYRESLHQPERAEALIRAWLDDRRDHRLSPRDAEGRVALASQYQSLLNDRDSAVRLLRAAWAIDPGSADVADAFRRLKFKKVNGEWVEPSAAGATADAAAPAGTDAERRPPPVAAASPAAPSDSLRNATPEEVRTRLGGKPNRKALVATQGQVTEQWVYEQARQLVYVTFLRRTNDPRPRVVSYYSVPRSPADSR